MGINNGRVITSTSKELNRLCKPAPVTDKKM